MTTPHRSASVVYELKHILVELNKISSWLPFNES